MARKNAAQLVEAAQRHAAQGELVQAEARYGEALGVEPDHVVALTGLGVLLVERGRTGAAIEVLERARDIAPGFAPIHSALGTAYADEGRDDQALSALEAAVKLETSSTIPLMQLARLHVRGNRKLEAIGAVRRVLRRDPKHPQALYMHAGLTGDPSFDTSPAPPELIADLFDRYANTFDAHLVGTLQYAVPKTIAAMLAPPDGTWTVVDLGCGTGLVGVELRPYAKQLVGGDLAWKMVARARERGLYDELYCEDLLATLARVTDVDLIVAADVFVYVGKLDATFAACARALRPGGQLAFSVESNDGDAAVLQTSLRYAHGDAYIRQLATEHGFDIARADPTVIRMNDGAPITGRCYLLQHP